MKLPKGFTKTILHPHGTEVGEWERVTYQRMVRQYKQRINNLDYLPENIRDRVLTYKIDDIPNLRAYRKMSPTDRFNLFERLEKFLSLKSTTKRGYSKIVTERYRAWKKKVPELTREIFDRIMQKNLFADAKKYLDSRQIIGVLKNIMESGSEEHLEDLIRIMMQITSEDADRKASQQEFSRLMAKSKIRP